MFTPVCYRWVLSGRCFFLLPERLSHSPTRRSGTRPTRRYDYSVPKLVEAYYDPDAPLLGHCMLLIFKAGGLRFLNPVRVTGVWDETNARRSCFGFEYGTLAGHMERGFERFFVIKEHRTGRLQLRIEDHWTYGDFPSWWSRLWFALFGGIA